MDILYNEILQWMGDYKKASVRPTTYDRLLASLALMDKYPISMVKVDKLQTCDIQRYVNKLSEDGYALSTIKKQLHLIGAYIEHETIMGGLTRPIHKAVKLPSETTVKKHKKEVIAYTKNEQKALEGVLKRFDSPAYYAVLLMLETGMRVGEVLAIGWDDIDWKRRAVKIRKTVVRIVDKKRSYIQNTAKSYSSNRTIPLSRDALDILKWIKDTDVCPSETIVHDENGERLSYEALRWWTQKACDEAGVKYYGQHVFRHTFATRCYERGCDVKMLSRLLGHADVTITYNVYIHLFGDALEEMRAVVD